MNNYERESGGNGHCAFGGRGFGAGGAGGYITVSIEQNNSHLLRKTS